MTDRFAPAFPVDRHRGIYQIDYVAIAAMQALLGNRPVNSAQDREKLAQTAYDVAESMYQEAMKRAGGQPTPTAAVARG